MASSIPATPDARHRRHDAARMKSFYEKMVRAGVVKPSIDVAKAYTLQFVNRKVGLDPRGR